MKRLGRFVRSTTGKVAIGVIVSAAISIPVSVWAATSFSDVPTTHPFYTEINAVADAGIAQGFGDGTYKPLNNVTRQAMAAFLERGVGRVASGNTGGALAVNSGDGTELAAASMDAGAVGNGTNGFVHVSGSVWASSNGATTANCPCTLQVTLFVNNGNLATSYLQLPLAADGEQVFASTSLEGVVPVSGDSNYRYRVVARSLEGVDPSPIFAEGSITATYSPLSGDGDSTQDYGLSCKADDAWEDNDTMINGSSLFYGRPAAAIACPGDHDWYSNNVAQGDTVRVTVDAPDPAEGDIDVCLYRYNVAVACSSGSSDPEVITYPSADEGFYYVDVYLVTDTGSTAGAVYFISAMWNYDGP